MKKRTMEKEHQAEERRKKVLMEIEERLLY